MAISRWEPFGSPLTMRDAMNRLFDQSLWWPMQTGFGTVQAPMDVYTEDDRYFVEVALPGLNPDECRSGVHVLDLRTGKILGSLYWPNGNQLFAIEAVPVAMSTGFPFVASHGRTRKTDVTRCFGENVAA